MTCREMNDVASCATVGEPPTTWRPWRASPTPPFTADDVPVPGSGFLDADAFDHNLVTRTPPHRSAQLVVGRSVGGGEWSAALVRFHAAGLDGRSWCSPSHRMSFNSRKARV